MKQILLILVLLSNITFGQKVIDVIKLDTSRNYKVIVDKGQNELKKTGYKKGSGYKQFERWKWKYNFLSDENGNIRPETYDQEQYTKYINTQIISNETTWEEVGPKVWNSTSSWNPGIGRITDISISSQNENIIYISTPGGGIWKTIDGGINWIPLTDNNAAWMDMLSVAVDPTNDNIVYAGSNNGSQLIKSTDGGITWTSIGRLLNNNVSRILINPSNTNNILVASNGGIVRTTDGGITWTKTYATTGIEDLEFKPSDPNTIYASGYFNPSILRSTDNGITWTALTSTEGIVFNSRTLLAVTPADPNKVYAVQAYSNEFGRLYVSNNSGVSFTTAVIGSPSTCTNYFGYETSGCGTGGQAGYDMAIAVNPNNANEIYIGGINIWKSTNGGSSFVALTQWSYPTVNFGYVHADIHVLKFSKGILYTGTDGGIHKQNLNGQWQDLSKGLGIRQFYRISALNDILLGGAQDNGTSVYKNSWYDWLGADGMDNIIISSNNFIGSSQYGQFYKTFDTGKTYSFISKPNGVIQGDWVTPIKYKNNKLYAGWNGVYFSNDLGNSWMRTSLGVTSNIQQLEVQGTYIYASISTTLYISKNDGYTWSSYIFPSSINKIVASNTNPNEVYIALNSTTNRVFKSTDGGLSFQDVSIGLPNIVVRTLTLNKDTLYAGLNIGVYRLVNENWTNITNNLPYSSINDIEVDNGSLYVATYGRGIWKTKISNNIIDNSNLYLDSINLTGTRNNRNIHFISWDFKTNDSIVLVQLQQSTDSFIYRNIFVSALQNGNYNISTLAGQKYFYKLIVRTNNFEKSSNVISIINPKKGKVNLVVSNYRAVIQTEKVTRYTLRNSLLQVIKQGYVNNYEILDLSNLHSGVYFIELEDNYYKVLIIK